MAASLPTARRLGARIGRVYTGATWLASRCGPARRSGSCATSTAAAVRRAGGGERIVITVDGRPVAQLGPLEPAPAPTSPSTTSPPGACVTLPAPGRPAAAGASPCRSGPASASTGSLREIRGRAMTLFLDASALVARSIDFPGREALVLDAMRRRRRLVRVGARPGRGAGAGRPAQRRRRRAGPSCAGRCAPTGSAWPSCRSTSRCLDRAPSSPGPTRCASIDALHLAAADRLPRPRHLRHVRRPPDPGRPRPRLRRRLRLTRPSSAPPAAWPAFPRPRPCCLRH